MPKPAPRIVDELSNRELKEQFLDLLDVVSEQKHLIRELRDEIARLKGGSGRPKIKPNKPSGMEQASEKKALPNKDDKRRGRGRKKLLRMPIEDQIIAAQEVPEGSRFKGYEDFTIQDLVIHPKAIRFRRERWVTPDGRTVVASLPCGIEDHFGPELRRFILIQYHQGQVTVDRLVKQLDAIGIEISKRQVVRLLIDGQDSFVTEAGAVLHRGLQTSAWVTVDDTGARHKAKNGFCTQIGNDRFAWFCTTNSKSRVNFLGLLRAGHNDYIIDAQALSYMRTRNLSQSVIDRLAKADDKSFDNLAAWQAHLERLGITALKSKVDPVRIATEGALWGSIKAHGLLDETVIVSDDAGQFNVGRHGLCWVHAERLIHRIEAFSERTRAIQQEVRGLIWDFYGDLKAYCRNPDQKQKTALQARFDDIFKRRTGFAILDRLLKRLHANKAELLMALERPEIPLHTNGSENDIRCQVTKRRISGGTRSDAGRDCRDTFLSLLKTCDKLGISFWEYLGHRLSVTGAKAVPYLPDLVGMRSPVI